jgi:tight adherence protein C
MTPVQFAIILVLAGVSIRLFLSATVRQRAAQRMESSIADVPGWRPARHEDSRLAGWLENAGYRSPSAVTAFLGATAGAAALGLVVVVALHRFKIVDAMVEALSVVPGGVGDALGMVASGASYIIFVIFAAAPALVVRAARRARVEAIEQDLAPALELLAILAEAGLGFDSSIARIQESEHAGRPLSQEFQIYQHDILGGIPRLESLRKLAGRVNLTSVSIFVSALIQAEQVGASLSETLRMQADDLRDRRKMRALLLAQALPVKLVFPLMACFLPGIFYPTLGPVISQFVDVMDSVIRRR